MQQNAPFCVLPTAFSLSRVGMYDITFVALRSTQRTGQHISHSQRIPEFQCTLISMGVLFLLK